MQDEKPLPFTGKNGGNAMTGRKLRSENTSIYRQRRHRTLYSKSYTRQENNVWEDSNRLAAWEHENDDR